MNARARAVFREELAHTFGRPLVWFLVVLAVLLSWGLSTGDAQISSGDSSVGGTRAWITSEFSIAYVLTAMITVLYSFFASIAAGLALARDRDLGLTELFHSTPLRPGEYVWGKFLALLSGFLAVLALHLAAAAFFNHVLPNPAAAEIRGPFEVVNYLRPAVIFALPALLFILGIAFFLGERWRQPATVFLFPVALFFACGFFLWTWSPGWLDPGINQALMLVDPAGFRWLKETWIDLDRGARFYNTVRLGLDAPFALSRLAFAGLGLLAVDAARRHLARSLRGEKVAAKALRTATEEVPAALAAPRALPELGMRTRPAGFFRSAGRIATVELRNLLASPGLYLFAALILLQTLGDATLALGAFDTDLLITPGQMAVAALTPLTLMLCLLLMFYTVESIERDRSTRLAAIAYATPTSTGALLFGKALANSVVGLLLVAATFAGCAVALLIQGLRTETAVGLDIRPFLLVWGLLLVPTLLLWTSFVTAVQAIGGQRYLTYGTTLAALVLTGYLQLTGKMSWAGNWMLSGALSWSDMGAFEIDRRALLLNRLLALGLTGFFTALAVRAFDRRQADAIGTLHRLQPGPAFRQTARLAAWAALPVVLASMLWLAVLDGYQGERIEKKGRDYWKQNLATWKDAPQPALAGVDLDLKLDPQRHWLHSRGTFEMLNDLEDETLARFALTGAPHWKNLRWTLDGRPYEPENRSGLYVFRPRRPLPPGGKVRVGFDFEGQYPDGISRNGGDQSEFILPSGVVLTSFIPSFVPVVGYIEGVGIKKDENDYEPRDYPDDFYRGRTDAAFGLNRSFPTRIRVTGPAAYTWNSVGILKSERVENGQRTALWVSDHPVRFFNVVGGRWKVRRGQGTTIYYHPGHEYNVEAMSQAFDASRRWYSEWFQPYPWRELKLSEFPNLDRYAQGFPTNITFSEGIGFLTESSEKVDAVFMVAAHEAAHQWWGTILTPGEGPGGNILSEGMSHFSTLLLTEKVKGEGARMEMARRLEERYGEDRRADAERPLVRIDGSREGDQTVTYDKGGWVFWMLLQHLDPEPGHERGLAGWRQFLDAWAGKPDHPVLQDFVAALRPFATDPAAYDAFTRQWFHEVVLPEYEVADARVEKTGRGWRATAIIRNAGTGRMPVDVAATAGERFAKGYREARSRVTLGAGESRQVEILCPFAPEKVVVDPDVQVLQLRRKSAVQALPSS